jgi:SAM-dependent methyltransferase
LILGLEVLDDVERVMGYCCPVCKGVLKVSQQRLDCPRCPRTFPIVGGVPDFFSATSDQEAVDDPNTTWLDPEIVEARDTVYRLSARELKGMAFCMAEIGRRSFPGCRILEVGMGTGHFTRWLAEVVEPGSEIYAFDFSWPIIDKARSNTRGLPGVTLFRGNARGALPFQPASFDLLFLRLAPLGPKGVPNVQAGFELLKPGGWYFGAGWEPHRYETPPTEWAMQHGYEYAEYHVWQYRRRVTAQERVATRMERERMASLGCSRFQGDQWRMEDEERELENDGSIASMTVEHLLIARKPYHRHSQPAP